ncbi:hypothetical protein KY343_06495 [Candidatus Woesearchaeota archaeon]|nr:hypothetical protein [Candidatus Woesearchaeota archaeon]
MVFFKDWRDDLRRMHAYSWSFFFELLASRFDIDYRNIGYLTLNELEDCLKKDAIDKKEIESRKNNPCIITLGGSNIKVIWSKIPKRYYDIIKQIEEKEKQLSIKGFTAQKGKAKGKVIVVKSYHDIKKVKKGHILVANTTHPNYLPAMQKAAAFITNEGGIASHAAIVSREMKKPCIVGTKIATKVLKTGDLVEVDAEKGIIKKIKSISS